MPTCMGKALFAMLRCDYASPPKPPTLPPGGTRRVNQSVATTRRELSVVKFSPPMTLRLPPRPFRPARRARPHSIFCNSVTLVTLPEASTVSWRTVM